MKTRVILAAIVLAVLAGPFTVAMGAEPGLLGESFRNPTDWLELQLIERLRYDFMNNYPSGSRINEETQAITYRTQFRAKAKLGENVDVNFGMMNYTWTRLTNNTDAVHDKDQVIFDIANVTMRNVMDEPITLVVGRQMMTLGKGWLVRTGTPNLGTTTQFFDAIRMTYDIENCGTLDIAYIDNVQGLNQRLKPINNKGTDAINEGDEKGVIVNFARDIDDSSNVEMYYIWKRDKARPESGGDSVDRNINTFGGIYSKTLDANWSYWAEGAYQTGKRNFQDVEAYGLNTQLIYSLNDINNTKFALDAEYLSGDDPDTDKYEGFDPLWGRHYRLGNIANNLYDATGRKAEYTNTYRVGATLTSQPTEKLSPFMGYHALWAEENVGLGGTSLFRGQLLMTGFNYAHSSCMVSTVKGEFFWSGGLYSKTPEVESMTTLLRYQLLLKF